MPKFLEEKLRKEYGNNPHAIYGTMNKIGAMKGNKETAKGREMERKHEKDQHMKHNIREMRIEVHRGQDGAVTGHTVHHMMMPKSTKKSGAFMEYQQHSYPFDADGHSNQHGHMSDHIAEHLGLSQPEGHEREEDDEHEAETMKEY
jgi:hypothetical protein